MQGDDVEQGLQRVVGVLHRDREGVGAVVPRRQLLAVDPEPVRLVVDDGEAWRAVAVDEAEDEVEAAVEEAPQPLAQQRVTQPRRITVERIAGTDMSVEHVGERRQREVGRLAMSPPTRGSSNPSSSRRSARPTSRRRASPASGPSGVSIAATNPSTTVSTGPMSTRLQASRSARAAVIVAARSGAAKSTSFEHGVDERADPRPARHRCQGKLDRPQRRLRGGSADASTAGAVGKLLVRDPRLLRLAADVGLVESRRSARCTRPAATSCRSSGRTCARRAPPRPVRPATSGRRLRPCSARRRSCRAPWRRAR